MVQLRRLNARWANQRHDLVAAGSRSAVIGLQLYGMSADLVRGALMTAVGLIVFTPLYMRSLTHWGIDSTVTRMILIAVAGISAAGAVYKVFHATPRTGWFFLAGLAAGLSFLVLR